ncbi:MAG: hypothetical protein JW893_09770 [Candidatus Omnitrophica bacterium]|nr:hypothetical protein [Candidatus Omnitrophota bacterium]
MRSGTIIQDNPASIEKANQHFQAGELYRAKKMARSLLDKDPTNEDAQSLMAKIITAEIAQQKVVSNHPAIDDMEDSERALVVKTWLERSRSLMEIQQYEEALAAAEEIFIYDPDSHEASRLVDEIRRKAINEGKRDGKIVYQMKHEEVVKRIDRYRQEAESSFEAGYWHSAKLAVEKILLLMPGDSEAQKLHKEIQAQIQG